jgi:hypothetical protein
VGEVKIPVADTDRKLVTTPIPNAVHSRAATWAPSSCGAKNDEARIAVVTIRHMIATFRRAYSPRSNRRQPLTCRQYQHSHNAIHRAEPTRPIRARTSRWELCGLRRGSVVPLS